MPSPSPKALLRYQVISAYLALEPARGQRAALRAALAQKTWSLPDGGSVRFSAETLRKWLHRYQQGGLVALEDAPRSREGTLLTEAQVEALCQLKREVPERSVDRLLHIAEQTGVLTEGHASRSTVHRLLQRHGLSRRPAARPKDLDRFEAEVPNDLWQSDLLCGPWLDDPDRPGKRRRAWLAVWLDDHSRLLLYGRWSFKQDLPTLELTFRQALRRCGRPRRIYVDNGKVYRSRHLQQVCAELGIHKVVFTTPYRPEGHGKVEAFNRLCRAAFVAEVKASAITTLAELNQAFAAWAERYYNRRVHSELQATPRARWQDGLAQLRPVDETALRRAFQWSETRTTDKTGVLSLFGTRYQAGPDLARRRVEVRFDIERLETVELWTEGRHRETVRALQVGPHRRKETTSEGDDEPSSTTAPSVDWLGHLVEQDPEPWAQPEASLRACLEERQQQDEAFVALLQTHLSEQVFDEAAIRAWLDRFGPIELDAVEDLVPFMVEHMGNSQHIAQYLDALHAALLELV